MNRFHSSEVGSDELGTEVVLPPTNHTDVQVPMVEVQGKMVRAGVLQRGTNAPAEVPYSMYRNIQRS